MRKIITIILVAILIKALYFFFAQTFGFSDKIIDVSILKRNDSYWYENIAINGHEKITPDKLGKCEDGNIEQSYYAFFPLYPILIGSTIKVTGLSFNIVAFIISIITSISLFVIFYQYVKLLYKSEKLAFLSTLFLIVLPFNYYFSVFYTESLFLLILLSCFYSIERNNIVAFIIISSLLVIARPNGLFMLVPLFIYFLEKQYSLNPKELIIIPLRNYFKLSAFIVPLLVFLSYCFYLRFYCKFSGKE
jgi:Gpi18-like mannosyltransferase